MSSNGSFGAAHDFYWESRDGERLGPYRFKRLTLIERERFNRLVEKYWQSPIDSIAGLLERLPERERDKLWKKAEEQMGMAVMPSFSDFEAFHIVMRTAHSRREFLETAIRLVKPDATDDECEQIYSVSSHRDLQAVYSILVGVSVDGDIGDPKARNAVEESDPEQNQKALAAMEKRENEDAELLTQFLICSQNRLSSPYKWIGTPSFGELQKNLKSRLQKSENK